MSRLEYMRVDQLVPAVRNPKKHDLKQLTASISRFGYVEPVVLDERTGRLVAGHGRTEALAQLEAEKQPAPEGVDRDGDGRWLVPVVRGWASRNDREAEAFLVASNRITEAGGWDDTQLSEMLSDLAASASLEGVGFSDQDLEQLLLQVQHTSTTNEEKQAGQAYTKKVEAPIYQPTQEKPPPIKSLVDSTKAAKLCAEIEGAQGLAPEERTFLKLAAQRHLVFDYQQIAEFYAHASAACQRQMENSALIIIDFNRAIELGFVKLTEAIAQDLVTDATT